MNRVRIGSSGRRVIEFDLDDGDTLIVEVNGRQYVGVGMPEPDDERTVEVVYWLDEDGEDNVTVNPPGVPVTHRISPPI